MEDLAETVVGFILRCRRVGDMSQRDLAAALGVSPSTVARWETGEHDPGARTLLRIAALAGLGVSLLRHLAAPAPEETNATPAPEETNATPARKEGTEAPPSIEPIPTWPRRTLRSRDGRRLPAHLDVHFCRDGPPHRWGWPTGQDVFVPYRSERNRLREVITPWDPQTAPEPTIDNTRHRMISDMATDIDHWIWQRDIRLGYRNRPVRKLTPEEEEAQRCLCPDECWIEQFCIDTCTCRCEVLTDRSPVVV